MTHQTQYEYMPVPVGAAAADSCLHPHKTSKPANSGCRTLAVTSLRAHRRPSGLCAVKGYETSVCPQLVQSFPAAGS